ncbi:MULTISPECIES: SDR family oxidoreductase [Rhizobium/Agrobacterium group]|uniref:SDR family NAD(P)-dependent oxidoreductase n=1 Tax=Rhizobium/Agrobacterium group TaxID=227290 RepID=UPI001AD9ABD2|nr:MULTISPECIES: SDR family oxidoreductase [Rhizobium/Agrobacterium group]MBO9112667.1 SDR family oxidoreductase [Agrobacterium sp. S2/73]QXZ76158.1 SDR family oxidoreductase [Agrobacterium sp. S7/73]QYA17293.1 SDR family oxidoreductase [Rhizobium sp. AB2/73]UEQ85590.1 SDR family oxidoreductase [Rhizobium sp. AB2/73]
MTEKGQDQVASSGKLTGRTAVVTGAGSGIGRATAHRFAKEGARVAVWDVIKERVEQTVSEIRGFGGDAQGFVVDVSNSESIAAATSATIAALGPVRVLSNNAAILDDYADALKTDVALWDRVIGVNLKGMWLVSRALLPSMIGAGGGAIVNVASISAFIAGGGGIAYTTAKHGVVGFTRQLAYDFAHQGIRVNAVAPGAVETGMTANILSNEDLPVVQALRAAPAGRHAQPDELANVILFLASEEASFVHGAVYVADGGWTIK